MEQSRFECFVVGGEKRFRDCLTFVLLSALQIVSTAKGTCLTIVAKTLDMCILLASIYQLLDRII